MCDVRRGATALPSTTTEPDRYCFPAHGAARDEQPSTSQLAGGSHHHHHQQHSQQQHSQLSLKQEGVSSSTPRSEAAAAPDSSLLQVAASSSVTSVASGGHSSGPIGPVSLLSEMPPPPQLQPHPAMAIAAASPGHPGHMMGAPGYPAGYLGPGGFGYVPSYLSEEPQDCKVCLDVATGYHYRVLTCEGCKGFFRRTVQKNLRYSCRWNNDCVIDRNTRNNCQRCRFEKCLRVGMATDMVLDAKQRDQRARLIDDNRLKRHVEESRKSTEVRMPKITDSDRTVITNLSIAYDDVLSRGRQLPRMFQNVAYHQELVQKITELEICALLCKSDSVTESDVRETKDLHPGLFNVLVEELTPSASRVISFASCVPGFMSLHVDDQTVLLKDALMEVLTIWNAMGYNEATENLSLIFGWQISGESREHDYPLMSMLEPIIKFARGIIPFRLDKTEVALLSALIILQADRPGLTSCEPVDALQSNILFTFERYVRHQHHQNRIRWPKLLMKVTELRTVSAAYAERTLTIKLDTCQALPRVFAVVFSDQTLSDVPHAAAAAMPGPSHQQWNSNAPPVDEAAQAQALMAPGLGPVAAAAAALGPAVVLPDTSYPSRPRSFS